MAALDRFVAWITIPSGPADDAFPITPHATDELPFLTRAIYVGTAGDLVVVTRKGSTVTFKNVPAGTQIAVMATRVLATSTASNLVGMV